MVLARSEPGLKGVSLFLLPRELEDGSHNRYRILRLKDRHPLHGQRRDPPGRRHRLAGGRARPRLQQMADMINNSRLSNGMRAAGLMRRAVTERSTSQQRRAFGQRLINMPLMRRQLAKMTVWAEQARSVMFQTAQAGRGRPGPRGPGAGAHPDAADQFRACRDARKVTGDAMEVRGGCGYIEDRAAPGARRTWARSGKAPATSSRWTCCAPSTAKTRCRPCAATSTSCWPKAPHDALAATQQDAIERSFAFAAMAAEGNSRGTGAAGGDCCITPCPSPPCAGKPASRPGNARGAGRPGVAASPGRARPVFGARERKRRLRRHPAIRAVAPRAHDAGGTAGAPPRWRQP